MRGLSYLHIILLNCLRIFIQFIDYRKILVLILYHDNDIDIQKYFWDVRKNKIVKWNYASLSVKY